MSMLRDRAKQKRKMHRENHISSAEEKLRSEAPSPPAMHSTGAFITSFEPKRDKDAEVISWAGSGPALPALPALPKLSSGDENDTLCNHLSSRNTAGTQQLPDIRGSRSRRLLPPRAKSMLSALTTTRNVDIVEVLKRADTPGQWRRGGSDAPGQSSTPDRSVALEVQRMQLMRRIDDGPAERPIDATRTVLARIAEAIAATHAEGKSQYQRNRADGAAKRNADRLAADELAARARC